MILLSTKTKNKIPQISDDLKARIDKAMEEIGITALADVKSNTPVDTGKLKKMYTYVTKNNGLRKQVIVGNILPYAPYVEFKEQNKGGRPHLRVTLRDNTPKYRNILEKHLRGL